jgi:hypothetical protein
MAFSGLVTLLNLLLCLVVGTRLLRIGMDRDRKPELALAVYFLASAFLSTVCQAIAYGAVVDPRLALPASASRWVLGLGVFGMAVGGAAVCVFTWLSFRQDNAWARRAVFAGSFLALGGWAFEALHEGFAITLNPGPGHWVAWLGRTAPVVWVAVECFRYRALLRRRLRIGLADPVVVNRFLLWGVWSLATFANLMADLVARVLYRTWAGTTTEVVMEVIEPVVIGTMAVTMVLGVVSAVTLFLTFFPTAAYRGWLARRAGEPAST